jgi:hypothetical protein
MILKNLLGKDPNAEDSRKKQQQELLTDSFQ